MVSSIGASRDYLALRLKPSQIQLTDRQREAVRTFLINKIPPQVLNPFVRMDAQERQNTIRIAMEECVRAGTLVQADYTGETHREKFSSPTESLLSSMYAQTVGLDVLEPLLNDEDVTSITVINEGTILYEKNGQVFQSPFGFENRERMVEVIKNLAIRGGQQLTPSKPTADLAFPPPQVVRIHLTIDPVTPRFGSFCALRRGREKPWTLDTLIAKGMMDDEVADFLRALMKIPASIIVGGEPASGKTTLLEVLLALLEGQHISLLEQAAELNPRNPLISYFEVPPNSDTVSLATLTIDSLRKNVQVVVIGETRGSEAGWLLFIAGAMKAILTTLHGRNSRQVVERLAANAQIQGDPPLSPFIGNRLLARESVANAFDFVVHCTQLPDGRRIITSIEYITGIIGEEIQLEIVVSADVRVIEDTGRRKIDVSWKWSDRWLSDGRDGHKWQLPAELAFALQMAEVRSDVSKEEPGMLDTRRHEQYQRACLALDQQSYPMAVRLLSEVLQPMPAGYLDAESKLRKALQNLGQWDDLLQMADNYINAVKMLIRDREWRLLQSKLNELDDKVELRVAVNSRHDLKDLREQISKGLVLEQEWIEARRRVKTMVGQGKAHVAAASLRRVPIGSLNREIQDEVRRVRLETLGAWVGLPTTSSDHALRIYHEMFALTDEELEPERLNFIVSKIHELEQAIGHVDIKVEDMQVASYYQAQDIKGQGSKTEQPDKPDSERHHLYLQGVMAMNESRWSDALQVFKQIPGYRRTNMFTKSLEALQIDD